MKRLRLLPLLLSTASFAATPQQQAKAILEKRCLSCHGQARMSGLDLRSAETMRAGGKRGAAIVPGQPGESLLIQAISRTTPNLEMPPGKPLPPEEIAALKSWIEHGAAWDNNTPSASEPTWWAFRKVTRPQADNIDSLIHAKLKEKGLTPSRSASRRTLIRRAFFDLHGLPPTPAEVNQFLDDTSSNAYEKLIDRLLASPRYGERWGRHWLDVARYADTGGFETDMYYANAWRYRDYVIQSFNNDKPYDLFIKEQVAGDELWPGDLSLEGSLEIPKPRLRELEARIGTGLYTVGPTYHEAALNGEQLRYEWMTDAVDTTSQAFLGLTIGCARCHDHKFDPISQKDYHRMMAIFAGSEERQVPVVSKMNEFGFKSAYPGLLRVEDLRAALNKLENKARERSANEIKSRFPQTAIAAFDTPEKKRTAEQSELAAAIEVALSKAGLRENATGKVFEPQYTEPEMQERERLLRELGLAASKVSFAPQTATILGRSDIVPEIRMTVRGDFHGTGEKVGPGFPAILGGTNDIEAPQRRKALALWLSSPEHPLTSRVMVNRIWAWHFGRGIVGTPGDFGRQGEAPTNPELLDWLASEFIQQGWSIKKLHKLIMLSDAYRQSTESSEANAKIDAENKYFWRMNRRRKDAEQMRDSVLAVAGTLNLKMGGRPAIPPLTDEEKTGLWAPAQWPVSLDPSEHNRRSVYIYAKRSFPYPMLTIFDAPESSVSCPQRDATTVAPQALALFNSQFMLQQARALAGRLDKQNPISSLWNLTLGRPPSEQETRQAQTFLEGGPKALEQLSLVVLNMNEFLYVE